MSLLDAGPLKVVVLGETALDANYEVCGWLFEDRHGEYLESEEVERACRAGRGVIEEIWVVPDKVTVVGPLEERHEVGDMPGVRVDRVDMPIGAATVRLVVRLDRLATSPAGAA